MESVTESQINKSDLSKPNILTFKYQLSLSNKKLQYKKQYLRLDSFHKNNDTCEMTRISKQNSINTNNLPLSTYPNKRQKLRVSFTPFINYIDYDPKDIIFKKKIKGENKEIIKEKKKKEREKVKESIKYKPRNEKSNLVNFQCTCFLM